MPTEQVLPTWITYPEAERFSGLSHTTLWRYVSSEQLKAARVGRSVRIHLPTLKAFMERAADSRGGSNEGPDRIGELRGPA